VGALPEVSIARLPATSRELFGREKELAWLDRCWEEGVHRAEKKEGVALVGATPSCSDA
jgi:hypothetical protein